MFSECLPTALLAFNESAQALDSESCLVYKQETGSRSHVVVFFFHLVI